jgi:predicted alpha/beta-hydrolase family hydrolase
LKLSGHCILSHGFESGPDATKVSALADVAERFGLSHERPDYGDLDAKREISRLGDVEARLSRLRALAQAAAERGPLILAGSSLGAYISARISLELSNDGKPVKALFLMAPPLTMGPLPALDVPPVPISIIHGWDDELIPAMAVAQWAQSRRARLLMVDDSHRLTANVQTSADAFAALLSGLTA